MRTRRSFVFCTELLVLASCATVPPPSSSPALHLTPCTIAGAAARCGTFDVAESPGSARKLALKVIVVPATKHHDSVIFPFSGGPGVPVIPGAEMIIKALPAERRLHDEFFVDMR